jgi:hypothetical protein
MTTFQIRNSNGHYFDGHDFYADAERALTFAAAVNNNGWSRTESNLSRAQFVDQTAYLSPIEDDDEAENFWTQYSRDAS